MPSATFFNYGSDQNSLLTPIDPHGLNQVDSSLLETTEWKCRFRANWRVVRSEFIDNPYGKQLDTFLDMPKSHDPYTPE